jgi:hypothetical protein
MQIQRDIFSKSMPRFFSFSSQTSGLSENVARQNELAAKDESIDKQTS